jgi:hypothetical protein
MLTEQAIVPRTDARLISGRPAISFCWTQPALQSAVGCTVHPANARQPVAGAGQRTDWMTSRSDHAFMTRWASAAEWDDGHGKVHRLIGILANQFADPRMVFTEVPRADQEAISHCRQDWTRVAKKVCHFSQNRFAGVQRPG